MRPLLATLLAALLAHAALASFVDLRRKQSGLVLKTNKTIAVRGDSELSFNVENNYYLADKQCTAVVEGGNLLCVGGSPPLLVQVTTGAECLDSNPPRVQISDQLDSVDIVRSPPCAKKLDVNVLTVCGYDV